MEKILLKEEVYRIIGAAMEVHTELGPGFLEAIYHEAMEIVLEERSIPFESHKGLAVPFRGRILKRRYEADFVCFGSIVVEIKARDKLVSIDTAKLINYLRATRLRVGLLINFGSLKKLEWKRFVV